MADMPIIEGLKEEQNEMQEPDAGGGMGITEVLDGMDDAAVMALEEEAAADGGEAPEGEAPEEMEAEVPEGEMMEEGTEAGSDVDTMVTNVASAVSEVEQGQQMVEQEVAMAEENADIGGDVKQAEAAAKEMDGLVADAMSVQEDLDKAIASEDIEACAECAMKADKIAEMASHVVMKAKVAAQPTNVPDDQKGNAMNPGKSAMGLWAERMAGGGGNPY